jgi:hypothetical protein
VLKGRFEDQDFGKQVEKEGEEKEVYFRRPASPFVSSNGAVWNSLRRGTPPLIDGDEIIAESRRPQ